MADKICIVIDSMIDLPREWARQHNVKIIPTIILFDGEYMNAVECNAKDVFAYYNSHNKTLPETRPTSVEMFNDAFIPLIHQGYKVVYLSTMPSISKNYQNALEVQKLYPDSVFVIDTKSSSAGTVPLVRYVVKLLESGCNDIKELTKEIQKAVEKVRCTFIVDDMNFIFENSNVSALSQFFARVLNVKPSMMLTNGQIMPDKKFTGGTEKALHKFVDYVFKDIKDKIDDSYLMIDHTDAEEKIINEAKEAVAKYVQFKEVEVVCAGAPISSHLGKGAIIFSFMAK